MRRHYQVRLDDTDHEDATRIVVDLNVTLPDFSGTDYAEEMIAEATRRFLAAVRADEVPLAEASGVPQ